MFKHYIITLFDLPRENKPDINVENYMSSEYLKNCFQVFDDYCFPSIFGQTNMNFTWLMLFSDNLDMEMKVTVEQYSKKMSNLIPLFVNFSDDKYWHSYVTNYIRMNTREEYILTSKLQIDHAYNINYVAKVQKIVNEGNYGRAFITFPHGLNYSTSQKIVTTTTISNNQCISLIMPNDRKFKTVYYFDQVKLEEIGITTIADPAQRKMWLEVDNANVSNNVIMDDIFKPDVSENLKEFNIIIPQKEEKEKKTHILDRIKLHMSSILHTTQGKNDERSKKNNKISLPVKIYWYIRGNSLLYAKKLRQYHVYRKGKRIANKIYDKQYLDTKEFNLAEDKLNAPGWTWAINDYKSRKVRKMNVGVPFPVSPLNTVWGYENITFDKSDLVMFQGSGKYIQASNGGHITIGKGTFIANNVGIVTSNHDIHDPEKHVPGKDVVIGEKCWIAYNAVILPGVILGDHTTVGAGAVVTKSVPTGRCVIGGNPARVIKYLDRRVRR